MRNVALAGVVGLFLAGSWGCGSSPMMAAESAPAEPGAYAPAAYPAEADVAGEAAPAPPPPAAGGTPRVAATPPAKAADGSRAIAGKAPPAVARAFNGVKAGEWDDNANYRDFLAYVSQQEKLGIDRVDVSGRQFLVALDKKNQGVPSCAINVSDAAGKSITLKTTASGRALFFPRASGLSGNRFTASSSCLAQNDSAQISFDASEADGAQVLKFKGERSLAATPTIDVVFVLDTTGSMSEEIQGVKDSIQAVVQKLDKRATVRIGLVEYKDKGDSIVTKTYPFTTDLAAFEKTIANISASGGGDTPENVNAGLDVALKQMKWSDSSSAHMAFLIADAPPHLDYQDVPSYSVSAKKAASQGVKIFTVSASGMDDLGQAVFRQVAQLTGGTNMFVLRGGAGSQSAGAGDAKSSCGKTHESFTSGNLDQLIVSKIALEIKALKTDPMLIAGRGQDENAKPCEKRILLVAD
jgi:uncharacterized protein YegL